VPPFASTRVFCYAFRLDKQRLRYSDCQKQDARIA
jgi:hypothetical protein